jgi:tetratricopeptide (TPR) repeat protein
MNERLSGPRRLLSTRQPGRRFILALLTVSALVLPAAAPGQSPSPAPEDPTAILAEARTLVGRGQAATAIQKLGALDRADPRVAQLLGVAYYQTDDHLKAIELLAPVAEKLPKDSLEQREANQVLGLSLYLVGRLPESIPYLEKTRGWAVDNIELLNVLGNVYLQTRQPEKAREVFAKLFKVAPDSAAAHLLTGQMMVRLEFEEMARAELQAAIAKDPRIPEARYLLAQSAIFRARFDEATELLQKELEVNPGNAMAHYRLGEALSRQNKWDEATAALQKSIWLQPYFSGPYIVLGRAYMKKGQPQTAEGMLRRAIQYDPNNKSAHYLLGQLLQQVGREEEAKRELELAERLQGEPGR